MGTGTQADPIIVDPGGTGDYTSLQTALSTEQGDITGDAGPFYIKCICTNGAADS